MKPKLRNYLAYLTVKRLLIIALILVSLAAAFATRGLLSNQTDTMIRTEGNSFDGLSEANATRTPVVSLDAAGWIVTTQNANLSNVNGNLVVSTTLYSPNATSVVVAEAVGLNVNLTVTPIIYFNVACDPGASWIVSIGWPGWNSQNGSLIVQQISSHPYLFAGLETKYGIIWLNSNYPSSTNACSGRSQLLRIDPKSELSTLGLFNPPEISGIQLKEIIPALANGSHRMTADGIFALSTPVLYSEISSSGVAEPLADGSAILVDNVTRNIIHEGWYPTRTYIQYSMLATIGAKYVIFEALKVNGTLILVRDPFVFQHTSTGAVGTFVDFVTPNIPFANVEPIASLSWRLEEGKIAFLFVPLGTDKLSRVTLSFVQDSWSRIPFPGMSGTFGFPTPSSTLVANRTMDLLLLTTVVPSSLMTFLCYSLIRRRPMGSKKLMLWILAAGIVLRLTVALVSAANDTENFSAVASIYYSVGAFGSEWVSLPGFVYIQTLNYLPYALIRQAGFADVRYLSLPVFMLQGVFVKIPSILADLGIAYFIFRIARRQFQNRAAIIGGLYLLNPLSVYVSGVYGQFDEVFTFLLLLSLFFAIKRHDDKKGGLLTGATGLVLPVGFAALLPSIFDRITSMRRRRVTQLVFWSSLPVLIGLVPVILEPRSPIFLSSEERFLHAIPGEVIVEGSFPFSAYGLNFWSSVGYGLNYRFLLQLFGYQVGALVYPIGAGLGFLFATFLAYRALKNGTNSEGRLVSSLFYVISVVTLFHLTYPTVFVQFAIWPVGLLFATYAVTKARAFLIGGLAASSVAGVAYVVIVDNLSSRATGIGSFSFLSPGATNNAWGIIGVTYSVIMAAVFILSILRLMREPE